MGEAEEEDLSDVAYGLFEILLSRALREEGRPLFELVEAGSDFRPAFTATFARFASDYPALAESLRVRFGSTDTLYALLTEGEGVVPTKTTLMYWIVQDPPDVRSEDMDDEKAGKWLIFLQDDRVDELWRKIRNATASGELGISAKVSTSKPNPESRDERKVIYVYTRDWADETDVMRVRERLREMGVIERIGYKRNIETFRGEYSEKGKKVTYYSA
ncbi:MAG TPA: putative phosphothreonine lyase domain-containing protein [Methanomicrobiales archaeon]|nr:putative phosphothreonine lyase domain-containing protein [Methanomicrobiales archaeon]